MTAGIETSERLNSLDYFALMYHLPTELDKIEQALPYLRLPYLLSLCDAGHPAVGAVKAIETKVKGAKRRKTVETIHSPLFQLLHRQHAYLCSLATSVEQDAAYLLDFFDANCFAPLRQELELNTRSPFLPPANLLLLLPALSDVSLADSWTGVATQTDFAARFEKATGGVFAGIDWVNICLAGSFVLGLLSGAHGTEEGPRGGTIEIHFHGIDSATAVLSRIQSIHSILLTDSGRSPLLVRCPDRLTFFLGDTLPHLHISLTTHPTLLKVLNSLSLDSDMIAYTGTQVLTTTRGARFLLSLDSGHAVNFFSRPASPGRIADASRRGIAFAVEGNVAREAGISRNHVVAAKEAPNHAVVGRSLHGLKDAYRRRMSVGVEIESAALRVADVEELVDVLRVQPEDLVTAIETFGNELGRAVQVWLDECEGGKLFFPAHSAEKGAAVKSIPLDTTLAEHLCASVATFDINLLLAAQDRTDASPDLDLPSMLVKLPASLAALPEDLLATAKRAKLDCSDTNISILRFDSATEDRVCKSTWIVLAMPLSLSISGLDERFDLIRKTLLRCHRALIQAVLKYRRSSMNDSDMDEDATGEERERAILDLDLELERIARGYLDHLSSSASSVDSSSPATSNDEIIGEKSWADGTTLRGLRDFVTGAKE